MRNRGSKLPPRLHRRLGNKAPEVTMHRTMLVNRDLGVASGKPFSISTITVIDAGESDLLTLSGNIE